jgi:20S proteasome alpha/beta subunit
MTLILTIQAKDGLVVASDTQITNGAIRSTGQKIRKLNDSCLWAASGELALVQRVEEAVEAAPKDKPLRELRDGLALAVRNSVDQLLRLDFRTQFCQSNPDSLLRLHTGDFVFAEMRDSSCHVLHVAVNGTPEWVADCFATGSGSPFAYALLQRYRDLMSQLTVDQASLLAYGVIRETIEVGAYGLGPPIDVWQIKCNEVECLSDVKKAPLEDAYLSLRREELDLFQSRWQ